MNERNVLVTVAACLAAFVVMFAVITVCTLRSSVDNREVRIEKIKACATIETELARTQCLEKA